MTKLQRLFKEQGQSPWLDNLTRRHLLQGELERLVSAGIRGVTSNPTIFAKSISGSAIFTKSFADLVETLKSKRADVVPHSRAAGSHA